MATQEENDRSDCFMLNIHAQVFVEGDADIVFWDALFEHFAPNLRIKIYPSGGDSAARGCGKLEKLLDNDGVNKHRILCFDSNYSRYWSGNTRYDLPFIMQTYAYAIDNFNCFPQNLNDIVKTVTRETDKKEISFDFNDFLTEYSKIVYPLFVYFVAKRKIDASCVYPIFENQTIFQQNINNYASIMQKLKEFIQNEIAQNYADITQTDFDITAENLKNDYKIDETNVWLFIRGHDFEEKVIRQLLNKITGNIANKKICEYSNKSKSKEEKDKGYEAILQNYKKHLGFDSQQAEGETAAEIQINESRERKVNSLLKDSFRHAIKNPIFPIQIIGDTIQNIAKLH